MQFDDLINLLAPQVKGFLPFAIAFIVSAIVWDRTGEWNWHGVLRVLVFFLLFSGTSYLLLVRFGVLV